MIDRYQRNIEYLRISVTQECNLKCIYCGSGGKYNSSRNLTDKEIVKAVEIFADLGIKKVRITGGEPLVRCGICKVIKSISAVDGIEDISLTTNGIYLSQKAEALKAAGLNRINISLDSLHKDKFSLITGGGSLDNVLSGIEKSLEIGLEPVKLNIVLIKGINDDEIDDFMLLAKKYPIDIRFIELMPIGKFGENSTERIVYNSEIIASHPELILCDDSSKSVSQYFKIRGYKGRIGFISSLSNKFCSHCNKIRLTADGKIRLCLGNNDEIDIKAILEKSRDEARDIIKQIIYEKPEGHSFEYGFSSIRNMNAIGG